MEDFVRRMNLDGYERPWVPLTSSTEPSRRGLLNEASFLLFSQLSVLQARPRESWILTAIERVSAEAHAYIHRSGAPQPFQPLNQPEQTEVRELALRTLSFFRSPPVRPFVVSPSFKGCGLINSCSGDVLVNSRVLVEVKSGSRSFRSLDYRQLLIYAALNWADTGVIFSGIELFNPRMGIHVSTTVESVAQGAAGQSATELMERIVQSFGAGTVSR